MSEKLSGLALIKAKLAELNKQAQKPAGGGSTQNLYWKPGQTKDEKGNVLPDLIRILPNPHTEPGYPFAELYFYYDFGKTWLSPTCFSKPDPIIDFCNDMTTGERLSKEEYVEKMKIKRKLMPKDRVYVPILVRGQETDGVKFWGFSKTIFNQLLEIMADDDYGDISDLNLGRDLTVKYAPPQKDGEYGKTTIIVKPNQTPASVDGEVLSKIEAMPNVSDLFTCPTYEELEAALQKYLNVEPQKPVQSNNTNVRVNHEATNDFDIQALKVPSPRVEPDMSDLDDIFAELDSKLKG
jgi:hypothetical protein